MMSDFNPFKKPDEPRVLDKTAIRNFVKSMLEISEEIKDAKENLKEVVDSDADIQRITENMKQLKEEREEIIKSNAVIQGYLEKLEEVLEDRKQIISDAKISGVPKQEIDLAIKAIKKDIDIEASVEIFASIADLID